MDSGFYAAVTGLIARTNALDLLAANLANTSTTGYKAQHEFYQALESSSNGSNLSPLNQATNNYAVMGGAETDLRLGSMEKTGNPLDIALEGAGFLTVKTAAGLSYTRNGSLHLDADGSLLTQEGDKVLAVPPDPKSDPVPIILPDGQVSISADGTISSQGAVVAQLNLVDFPHGTPLTAQGNSYFQVPKGAAQTPPSVTVRQGELEGSNYNPVQGTVDLVALQRHAQLLERALTIFDTDFNQAPARDIALIQ
jgi:flagellar basal-body rod protein FlgF